MFDLVDAATSTSGAAATLAWAGVENAASARRLAGMVAMLDARCAADGSADRDQWCLDNWGAVCAEIGATQQLTSGAASRLLLVGTALRDRLPKVAALFTDGLIGYRLVSTIAHRTGLIKDPAALRDIDSELAAMVQEWGPMSLDKTDQAIDALIAEFDQYALRRTQEKARGRAVDLYLDDDSGLASLWGTLFATDAVALDRRLDALASTVCENDPRTRDQRRADAMGGLAHGQDCLACLCGNQHCLGAISVPSSVVVYVVAPADSVTTPPAATQPDHPDDGGTPADPLTVEDDTGTTAPDDDAGTDAGRADRDASAQHASLDGESPPMFSKPLREMTLAEVFDECNADPGEPLATPPGVIIGGPLLPGPVVARAALHATVVPIVHPGNAPPETRYTPSRALADFVRSRDLTCRFPHCGVPADRCDTDHTIPHPHGPTCASNLKCLCRFQVRQASTESPVQSGGGRPRHPSSASSALTRARAATTAGSSGSYPSAAMVARSMSSTLDRWTMRAPASAPPSWRSTSPSNTHWTMDEYRRDRDEVARPREFITRSGD